jgi:hypothetical protein
VRVWVGGDPDGRAEYGLVVARLAEQLDGRDAALLRRLWGTGIGAVMVLAVAPYPITAFFVDDEIPHRIHNVVGALHYLPLWAVPVLMFTWGSHQTAAWRVALVTSCTMFLVGIASGDLIPSLSWLPLITLIPLWRTGAWRSPRRPSLLATLAAACALVVTVRHAPALIDLQRLDLNDSHSLRFHFSGMAAAYIAVTGALATVALYPVTRTLAAVIAVSTGVAGAGSLLWTNYESALPTNDALLMVAAGLLAGATLLTSAVGRRTASGHDGARHDAGEHDDDSGDGVDMSGAVGDGTNMI